MPTKPPPHVDFLLRYLFSGQGPQSLQPGAKINNNSIANYVLASSGWMDAAAKKKQSRQSPSFLSRVIDAASIPNYAIAEGFRRTIGDQDPVEALGGFLSGLPAGAGSGIRGAQGATGLKHKTTFSDVLGEMGVDNSLLKYGGGLALDIALDPTSYIGLGAAKSLIKKTPIPETAKPGLGKEFLADVQDTISKQKLPKIYKQKPRTETQSLFPAISTISRLPEPEAVARVMPKPRPIPVKDSMEDLIGRTIGRATLASVQKKVKPVRETLKQRLNIEPPSRSVVLNPAKQANLFNTLQNQAITYLRKKMKLRSEKAVMSPKFRAARATATLKMLASAEDELELTGRILVGWDGTSVRLGDVIAELPEMDPTDVVQQFTKMPGSKVDPRVAQAIENARARGVMQESEGLKKTLSDALSERVKYDSIPISEARKVSLSAKIIKNAGIAAKQTGSSPAGARSVQDMLKDIFYSPIGSPIHVAERYKGRDLPEAKAALTKALEKVLDPHKSLKSESVVDWVMARMATWWKQKDLRPLVLHSVGSAIFAAERRTAALRQVTKKYNPEQIRDGWMSARGATGSSEIGLQMRQTMEDMTDIVTRSAVSMDDINKHLARTQTGHFLTDSKKIEDSIGRTFNFSPKGEGWLNSWKTWETDRPLEMLYRFTLAIENAAREKAVLDEVAERFGAKIPSKEFRTKIDHHYLQGYYFDDEIAPQLHRVIKAMDSFYDPKSEFMRFVDKAISAWKSGVTIYAPSHHIRNLIGDTFLSWVAGVNDMRVYRDAVKVLRTQNDKYIDMSMDPAAMFKTVRPRAGETAIFKNKAGVGFTPSQLYAAAANRGLMLPAKTIEDVWGSGELIKQGSLWRGEGLQPLGGRGQRGARKIAETREHYVRLAHFLHEVRRSNTKSLPKIFDESARTVRKWHPDGLDLTLEERRVLRRVAPFYSWTRKAIPLIIEGAVQKPGKTILFPPRVAYALQGMLGIETEAPSEQFPVDQLFPLWIREKGIGPVGGTAGNYTIVNPSNPFIDLTAQFSNPTSGVAEMLNPLVRIPMEQAFGREVYSQAPIEDQGEYFTAQIPIASNVQRILNVGLGGTTPQAPNEQQIDMEAFLNWMTALGIRDTGKYERQAYFEELERRRNAR